MELVIFDCDGVLVDSERIALRVNVLLGRELGWSMEETELVDRFLGRSSTSVHRQLAERLGGPAADRWEELFRLRFNAAVDEELTAVPGVAEMLDVLSRRTCVASSGTHDKMRRTLGVTGLYPRFAGRIFSATEVRHGKPAPDLFLHAAERMGVEPAACAVIEDSQYGVQAARAAGMRSFGYTGGLTPADWLAGPGTVLFDDMRKLPGLLAS